MWREDGFLFLESDGMHLEQRYPIAHHLLNPMSEKDKERLLFYSTNGRWADRPHKYGFKEHRQGEDDINPVSDACRSSD
jgi:hypothetical protein